MLKIVRGKPSGGQGSIPNPAWGDHSTPHSTDPSWWRGCLPPLPKNPTPLSAFGLDFRPFRPHTPVSPNSLHFPSNGCGSGKNTALAGFAGTRMSPFWILLELRMTELVVTTDWSCKACKAAVKSSPSPSRTQ